MNLFQKALFNLGLFKGIDDNPYYSTYQITGGWRFNDFSQETVINKGYAGNADLYAIVRKIASCGGSIPLDLVEINSDGEKEVVTSGELYDLLQQPNRLQTMNEFVEEALIYLLLSGNNYVQGYRALGMGDAFKELNNLPSQFVTIEGGSIAEPIKNYWYQEVNNLSFSPDEIMHTRYANPKGEGVDRLYGLSPLEAGNNALQSSNNIYDAKGAIVKNSGVNGIISSQSERSFKQEEAELMQSAWEKKNSNPLKFGRNLVTSAAINYTQLGLSPDKLQLLEGAVMDLRTLCNIYNVPSQLFNDIAGTTFNNMAAAKKSLYTEAVIPNMELWLQNFNNWFVSSWAAAENKNYCVELNTSGIEVLQADQKLEAEKDKIISDTIVSVLNAQVSNESKVQTLIYSIGMSEEEARLIVGEEIIEDVD
jgi:HK97 family phage portal protein